MPHAVILDASRFPEFGSQPLEREGSVIHKVVETARLPRGWLLKSLVIDHGQQTRFLTRVDRREDGLLVRLDDHMEVERSPLVFDHLAAIASAILSQNPGARLGPTNLEDRIAARAAAP